MSVESEFVSFSASALEKYLERIETCIVKLTLEQIWFRHGQNQNAAGNLMLHLTGNVRQWILAGVGGAPDTRIRDLEFAARGPASAEDLARNLRATVSAAVAVIRDLSAEDLLERSAIQGQDVTKLEAVYHVVEHFAGHAFQIMFATKLLTGEDLGFYAHLNKAAEKAP
jgi:uncharacterized damage-inducible protein DinB